jgi:uncharacterized protein YggU (UPF0235/DUF167 family)
MQNKFPSFIEEKEDILLISVYVKPNSKKEQILVENNELVIFTNEVPVGGKANKSVIKMLAKFLEIHTSQF